MKRLYGKGSFGFVIDGDKDGMIYITVEDEYHFGYSPKEAVEIATKIINHAWPHTRTKRTFKDWDTTVGRNDYINQGCHRPGGH